MLYFLEQRFLVIVAVIDRDAEKPMEFNRAKVLAVARDLKAIQLQCSECVQGFAAAFLLLLESNPRMAHDCAVELLIQFRVGSGVVERAHLPAQELHRPKQRGLALAAESLALMSYQRSVALEARTVASRVRKTVLKTRDLSEKRFAQLSRTFRMASSARTAVTSEASQRRQQRKVFERASCGSRRTHKMDAYRAFRKANWTSSAKVGSQQHQDEERRVSLLWRDASVADKAVASGEAAAEELSRQEVRHDLTLRTIENSKGTISKNFDNVMRKKLFTETWKDMKTQFTSTRSTGLGIMGVSSGLDVSQVPIVQPTMAQCNEKMKKLFAYDATILPNARGSMQPAASCHDKTWGRCISCPHVQFASNLVYNCFVKLKTAKYDRCKLPIRVVFRLFEHSHHFLLTDYFGVGVTLLLLKFVRLEHFWHLETTANKDMPMMCTGQQAFCDLLKAAKVPAEGPETVDVEVWAMEPAESEKKFALSADAKLLFSAMMPAKTKLKMSKGLLEAAESSTERKGRLPFGLSWPSKEKDGPLGTGAGGGPVITPKDFDELDEDEAAKVEEAELAGDDFAVKHTTAGRVGIVGFDVAKTSRGCCVVCLRAKKPHAECSVLAGDPRFFWRSRPAEVDRSLHAKCAVVDQLRTFAACKDRHIAESAAFLNHLMINDTDFTDEQKKVLKEIESSYREARQDVVEPLLL